MTSWSEVEALFELMISPVPRFYLIKLVDGFVETGFTTLFSFYWVK